MVVQSGVNNIIVTIATKYVRHFSDLVKNAQIAEAKISPADLVNIVGQVVSAPRSISDRKDYEGFSVADVKEGDTAIFRFDVVYSFLKFKDHDEPLYKNEFWYKGQSYWKVDVQGLFAVIRDGQIIMQNGYVMVEEYPQEQVIILPQYMRKLIKAVPSKILHIGNPKTTEKPIEAKQFDTVYFNPKIAQHYSIGEKKFCIIKQSQILGFEKST